MSNNFVQIVDQITRKDRRWTLDEIHEKCAEIFRTILHDVISNYSKYQKLCARWVPKMLTEEYKKKNNNYGKIIVS